MCTCESVLQNLSNGLCEPVVELRGLDDKEIVVEGELAASTLAVVAVSVADVDVAFLTNTNLRAMESSRRNKQT